VRLGVLLACNRVLSPWQKVLSPRMLKPLLKPEQSSILNILSYHEASQILPSDMASTSIIETPGLIVGTGSGYGDAKPLAIGVFIQTIIGRSN
jgi:hypothetical protein